MRRQFILATFLIFLFMIPTFAQDEIIEFGSACELKGVTKVYIDTGTDAASRTSITEEI